MNNWNQAVDCLLDKIRMNCIMLASKHITNHLYYLNCSKYFEIPVIILSVVFLVRLVLAVIFSFIKN